MAENFTIPFPSSNAFSFGHMTDRGTEKRFNLEDAGRSGSGFVKVQVAGYWGTAITMELRRLSDYNGGKWIVTLSHSSGGRLKAPSDRFRAEDGFVAIEDDLEAEKNFGNALIEAAKFGETLLSYAPDLERWYQEERREAVV